MGEGSINSWSLTWSLPAPFTEPEIASLLPTLTQKQVLAPTVLTGEGEGMGMGHTTAQPASCL